jgi:hypothetical protein
MQGDFLLPIPDSPFAFRAAMRFRVRVAGCRADAALMVSGDVWAHLAVPKVDKSLTRRPYGKLQREAKVRIAA